MSPEQLFGGDAQTIIAPIGASMRPFLLAGRDSVTLARIDGRLKRGDVALFERPDGTLVLHRVMRADENGYAFLGDAQDEAELETGVTEAQLLGVMTGFFHGKRYCSLRCLPYRVYRRVFLSGDGPRRAFRALWSWARDGKNRLSSKQKPKE